MEAGFLKTAGQIAGIGGLAIGTLLILFRDVIRKNVFPTLSKNHAYSLLRLILILTWSVAVLGVVAWYFSATASSPISKSRSANEASAQPKDIEIAGQIREQALGISDASIIDLNSSGSTKSDLFGRFTLKVKEARLGWARIQVSKQGYDTWEDYVQTTGSVIVSLERKP
jgi:hypothetical protein